MGTARVPDVREASFAGSWYPGDPAELGADLDRYLAGARPFTAPSRIRAVVSPHAGYAYSGPTAGWCYRSLEPGAYSAAVVLAPSHRVPFDGVSPWPRGAYRTPLGDLPVDEALCAAAVGGWKRSRELPAAHVAEHSLELQLPFLARRLGAIRIVPLLVGDHSPGFAQELAARLTAAIGGRDDVLVVASTDLSHFHPAAAAERLDGTASRCVEGLDAEGLAAAVEDGRCELCGVMPVLTVLGMARARAGAGAKVLSYTHSGQVTGDRGSVVGYLAAVLW